MGDVGDYWRDHREFKRAARTQWVECPSPGCQFGGNPVKVPPGGKCRHCGWRAPGKRGNDIEYARQDETQRHTKELERQQQAQLRNKARRCSICGKRFKSKRAKEQHIRDYHKRNEAAA